LNKKILRSIFRRRIVMVLLFLLQIAFFAALIIVGGRTWRIVSLALHLFSLFAVLHVIVRSDNAPFKLMWVVIILILPLFGGALYIWTRVGTRALSRRLKAIGESSKRLLTPPEDALPLLPDGCSAAHYLQNHEGFPVYTGTRTEYLSPGEAFFRSLMPALESAENYIFLEFFIIDSGAMWDAVLEVLKRKAAAGVDVRIIYDDFGCLLRLPKNYPAELAKHGIRCHVFNPFRIPLSAVQNNRDHRKIVSIDGRIAFTGGLNMADEYINEKARFGYWKDCAVRLDGDAAWSLTVIFLEMWRLLDKTPDDFEAMRPRGDVSFEWQDGFVQPFADSPLSPEHTASRVFLALIGRARSTLYINTPYLILDDAFVNAICSAAKFGVDVRIVTPHHADKPIVHATTRSYYHDLLLAGVRIYEFSDGFLHSKTIVADGEAAVIGTSNFDYRSLYLHFECGVLMYGTRAVKQLDDDFSDMLSRCQEMRLEDFSPGLFGQLRQAALRLFAPLM